MPLYEYHCPTCGLLHDELRKVSERGHTSVCPRCGDEARPVFSAPAGFPGASLWRDLTDGGWRAPVPPEAPKEYRT